MTAFSVQLLAELVSRLPLPEGIVGIYVFGSARYKAAPNDVDLLLVYDPLTLTPERVMAATESVFFDGVRALWPYPVDLTALTVDEERTSRFVASEGAVAIWAR